VKVPPLAVRRLGIDPVFVVAALAGVPLGAAVAAVGLLAAPLDRRLRLARVAALAAAYLLAEAVVLLACLGTWLARPLLRRRWDGLHLGLLRRVLGALVAAASRLVGFRVVVEEPPRETTCSPGSPGSPDAQDGPGSPNTPLLILCRHAGVGDSFTLVHLLIGRYGRRPRVVLAARMRLDPALDVILGRTGACFVSHGRHDAAEAARVHGVARRLSGRDALVIFPEGANYTDRRRGRLIARLRARGRPGQARLAEEFSHVLPPRPAGVIAALEAGTATAAIIVAHTGLDRLASPGAVWAALPLTVPLTLRWWCVPREQIPAAGQARQDWLTLHWAIVDAWIDARRAGTPA
jgi:1-acyl-sn-glycerol-3-phosphate acyltransferase